MARKTVPAADRDTGTDDNNPPDEDAFDVSPPVEVGGIAGERLKSFIERIERLEEEKRTLAADIKEVKSEAKANGFDVKVINFLIKLRRQEPDDVAEFDSILDVYKRAIGMTL
jgi:uncharacterized protein (UPF0335 family)